MGLAKAVGKISTCSNRAADQKGIRTKVFYLTMHSKHFSLWGKTDS